MHTIKREDLAGTYKTELASDSESGKRLTFHLVINEDGYFDEFEVTQKGVTLYNGQAFGAAIREYNRLNKEGQA